EPTRTLSWQIHDANTIVGENTAGDTSTINVTHAPPSLGGAGNTVTYIEKQPPITLDGGLTLSDSDTISSATVKINGFTAGDGDILSFTAQGGVVVSDSDTITSATVSIQGFTAGDGDVLSATAQGGVTVSYANGVLTLSGAASAATYQSVLDSVKYSYVGDPTKGGTEPTR